MRSRFVFEVRVIRADLTTDTRITRTLGLAARGSHGARRVRQTEFAGAVLAKPDEDVWRVGPEERADPSCHPHGVIDAQALQRLDVKYAVVEIAVSTVITVNTLSFTKHLFRHDESPAFPPAPRCDKPGAGNWFVY